MYSLALIRWALIIFLAKWLSAQVPAVSFSSNSRQCATWACLNLNTYSPTDWETNYRTELKQKWTTDWYGTICSWVSTHTSSYGILNTQIIPFHSERLPLRFSFWFRNAGCSPNGESIEHSSAIYIAADEQSWYNHRTMQMGHRTTLPWSRCQVLHIHATQSYGSSEHLHRRLTGNIESHGFLFQSTLPNQNSYTRL